ncbi:Ankyrin repeat domain-containing protein 40 [Blyttiomyces sp. JEL0837]|nr:Ankyrin repeat domain-containing protein 40 [Blyttiomyces sp. JEL0837]
MSDTLEQSLLEASAMGNLKAVDALLAAGVSVNAVNRVNGWSALHWSSKRGHPDLIRFLLSRGADPNMHNSSGLTPADLAANDQVREAFGPQSVYSSGSSSATTTTTPPPSTFIPNYLQKQPDSTETAELRKVVSAMTVPDAYRDREVIANVGVPINGIAEVPGVGPSTTQGFARKQPTYSIPPPAYGKGVVLKKFHHEMTILFVTVAKILYHPSYTYKKLASTSSTSQHHQQPSKPKQEIRVYDNPTNILGSLFVDYDQTLEGLCMQVIAELDEVPLSFSVRRVIPGTSTMERLEIPISIKQFPQRALMHFAEGHQLYLAPGGQISRSKMEKTKH